MVFAVPTITAPTAAVQPQQQQHTRYFTAHSPPTATTTAMLAPSAAMSMAMLLPAPPNSGSTIRTRTTATGGYELEPDLELEASFMVKPDDSVLQLRASRSDVSAAKLKLYHERCNKLLEQTLHLFRQREERERIAIARSAKKQRVNAVAAAHTTVPNDHSAAALDARDRQWKLVREANDVRVYRNIRCSKQRMSTIMASGTIHGSLRDVMSGLYAETTTDAQVLHTLLSRKFVDASVLHVDRRTSGGGRHSSNQQHNGNGNGNGNSSDDCDSDDDVEPFQFSGITWTALQTRGLFFCKNRDLLCFKKMDCFTDDFGDEFGYLVLQSIEPTDECAKAIATKARAYVRGYISLGMLFKKTADDRVSLFVHGDFNPNGRLSRAFGDACIASSIVALANTAQSGQAKNLSMLLHSFSTQQSLVRNSTTKRDRCSVCARSMFFWDAPQHCRGCWQRTCRSCRVKRPIFCAQLHRTSPSQHHHHASSSPTGSKPHAPCTETFCLQCVATVVPSGVRLKAKLLQQLAKKRKRTGSVYRQTLTSSLADSGIGNRRSGDATAGGGMGALDDRSSLSIASFPDAQRPSSMVDVVEQHLETQQRHLQLHRMRHNAPFAGQYNHKQTSSMPSLISFSSNDAGTISDYSGISGQNEPAIAAAGAIVLQQQRPNDYRVGSRQYHMDVLAAGLTRRTRSHSNEAAEFIYAPRRSTTTGSFTSAANVAPPATHTDEYYNNALQRYLRSNRSYVSVNSTRSSAAQTNASGFSSSSLYCYQQQQQQPSMRTRDDQEDVVDAISNSDSATSIATVDRYFKRL